MMRRAGFLWFAGLVLAVGCAGPGPGKSVSERAIAPEVVRVTWYGQSMFLVQDDATSLVTDPYGPEIGYIVPKLSANIVLVSNSGYSGPAAKAIGGRSRIIASVGENYVGDFVITGLPSQTGARSAKPNRIYYWKMKGVTFAHMGDFGQRGLTPQQEGLLRNVDVLMIPVGGRTKANARTAARITQALSPKVVIPMDYKTPAVVVDLAPVEVFSARFATIKRVGDTVDVTRRELPEETEVWVMKYRQQRQ